MLRRVARLSCVHTVVLVFSSHRTTVIFFFFNDTATTEIYTLSLHDALPISRRRRSARTRRLPWDARCLTRRSRGAGLVAGGRKSTRLNSSHGYISYAGFCFKKKKENTKPPNRFYNNNSQNGGLSRTTSPSPT